MERKHIKPVLYLAGRAPKAIARGALDLPPAERGNYGNTKTTATPRQSWSARRGTTQAHRSRTPHKPQSGPGALRPLHKTARDLIAHGDTKDVAREMPLLKHVKRQPGIPTLSRQTVKSVILV